MSTRILKISRNVILLLLAISTFATPHLLNIVQAQSDAPASVLAEKLDATFAADWMQLQYQRIEAEKISAPAGSRLYAYTGVTLYEAVLPGIPGNNSLAGQLTDMPEMPQADVSLAYDWPTVANNALFTVNEGLMATAAKETHRAFADLRDKQLAERKKGLPEDAIKRSMEQGEAVGKAILAWAAKDGFNDSRGEKFTMPGDDSSKPAQYVLTTPGTQPVEPYWGSIRPFALPDAMVCDVRPNMEFSTDPNSAFYQQAMEVKVTRDNLTEEQKAIANFWVDTPGITGTPSGHWVSIENQLVAQLKLKLDSAAQMYAMVGVALGDAFIACWNLKYRVMLLRPETYIKRYIRKTWAPYIQTPPFPEYPSGHSVASSAAAEVLTSLFGTVAFKDNTHKLHNQPPRSFTSFEAAANEAAISRLYGGIHYRSAIENGLRQGRCIGGTAVSRIQLRPRGNG